MVARCTTDSVLAITARAAHGNCRRFAEDQALHRADGRQAGRKRDQDRRLQWGTQYLLRLHRLRRGPKLTTRIVSDAARCPTRTATLTASLVQKPKSVTGDRNANLFDSAKGIVRPYTTVVASGNRIAAVGPDGSAAVPADAEVIDATGKTILPGPWDGHIHIDANRGYGMLCLAAGITTMRARGPSNWVCIVTS